MNLSREFTQEINGKEVHFQVNYNPQTHFFTVIEDGAATYTLSFNMETREWKSSEDPEPSLPVDQLALLIQKSFGVFV